MSIYAPTTDYTWELIASYGIDPRPVFERAGVDPELRYRRDARIPRAKLEALNAAAVAATGDPALGLRVVQAFHPSHLGAMGFDLLASGTLRSVWNKIARYSALVSDAFELTLEESGDEFTLGFGLAGGKRASPTLAYAQAALLLHIYRLMGGDRRNPLRVAFAAPATDDLTAFETLFRCPLQFDAPRSLMVFDATELDEVLPRANPELEQATHKLVLRYLSQRERADIVGQVRAVLTEELGRSEVTMESVADGLHMTSRTLRRRLEEAGWNFRGLLTDVRRRLALLYIQDHSLTLTQISLMLGFAEQSSFTRAFKGWTGQSPTAARAEEASAA